MTKLKENQKNSLDVLMLQQPSKLYVRCKDTPYD